MANLHFCYFVSHVFYFLRFASSLFFEIKNFNSICLMFLCIVFWLYLIPFHLLIKIFLQSRKTYLIKAACVCLFLMKPYYRWTGSFGSYFY